MTRYVRFANNATTKLAASLSSVGLTISVTPGEGAKFPALTAGQFFMGTLIKADGTKEVVKVTARSTDTMTIVRAAEAVGGVTTSYAFNAGDKFEARLTAGTISDELDRLDAAAYLETTNKNSNYTLVEADVSKLVKVDTSAGNVTITLPQISTLTGSFEIQVQKNTGDANGVSVVRQGTDTINGQTSYNLTGQYQCVWLVADLVSGTWTAITSASASNIVVDQFTGSGTAGPFTLSGNPGSKNNTLVTVGGVYQTKSTYTVVGAQLTLGGIVAAGVLIECVWSQPVNIGAPSNGTVDTSKLAQDVLGGEYATLSSVAGTNTITASLAGVTRYALGQTFRFVASGNNTGATTININGLGAVAVTKNGANALDAGDIVTGASLQIFYDGTRFQLSSGAGGGAKAQGVIYENGQTITSNYTISTGKNAMSAGPITIADGVTITVPDGSTWTVV